MAAEGSVLGLLFEISADPSKAITATNSFRDQASKAIKEFEEGLGKAVTESLGITKEFAVGMGVAAGAVAGLGLAMFELADKAAEVGAKIYEVHERSGLTSETLSGLMAIAKETGGSFDSLSTGLGRATVNLQKLVDEPGSKANQQLTDMLGGAKAVAELGLKPMDERLREVTKSIFEITDVGERNRQLQAIWGRAYMENVEVLKEWAESADGGAAAAKRFGVFFNDEAAAKAKQFKNELAVMKAELASTAEIVGAKLIPAMSGLLRYTLILSEHFKESHYSISIMLADYIHWATNTENTAQKTKTLSEVIKEADAQIQKLTQDALANSKALEADGEAAKETAQWWESLHPGMSILRELLGEIYPAAQHVQTAMEKLAAALKLNAPEWERMELHGRQLPETLLHFGPAADPAIVKLYELAKAMDGVSIAAINTDNALIHQSVELRSLPQLWQQVGVAVQQADQQQRNYTATFETWASKSMSLLETVNQGITKHSALHKALTIADSVIRAAWNAAKALEAYGDLNFWSAAQYTAAAVSFGALAATGGGGGGGGGGVSASGGGPGGNIANPNGVPIAAGASGSTGGQTLHVVVMGETQAATHLAGILNNGIRSGGVQLQATHGPTGNGL